MPPHIPTHPLHTTHALTLKKPRNIHIQTNNNFQLLCGGRRRRWRSLTGVRTSAVFSRDTQYVSASRTVLHLDNCRSSWSGTGRGSFIVVLLLMEVVLIWILERAVLSDLRECGVEYRIRLSVVTPSSARWLGTAIDGQTDCFKTDRNFSVRRQPVRFPLARNGDRRPDSLFQN